MQLRLKITLLLVVVIAASVSLNYVIQRVAVMPSFRALEHESALADWQRCENAISRDLEALSLICFDWAAWDDTYEYVQGNFPEFYAGNLSNKDWFVDQDMDVLYVCRPDGSVYWSHVVELEEGVSTQLAFMPRDRIPLDHPLMQVNSSKESKVDGIMMTELGFVMLASRPIMTSMNEGPVQGVLIFGRRLSDERVLELREQTGVEFEVLDSSDPDLNDQDRAVMRDSDLAQSPIEDLIDSENIAVRGLLTDLEGAPSALLRTAGVRSISQYGENSLSFATWSLVASGLLTLAVLLTALRGMVIQPLVSLTEYATRIGESGHVEDRLRLDRSDELGTLATSFDRMLEQLDEYRASSVSMSRQAGMAEVAAGVLHNVGNAMTNVSVLADVLSGRVGKSKAMNLTKVSGLLEDNRDELSGFFAPGNRGAKVPEYVSQLAGQLEAENQSMRHDLAGLQEGLKHVRQIVASHQGLVSSTNFVENSGLADIVNASLPLVEASFERHGVLVETESQGDTQVSCDRSKLSQVLVNLLTNAKESMTASGTPSPCVRVRVGRGGPGRAFVEVSDNGPGILPEHVEKLFSKGFSTKPQGHGIGLHFCWLAVSEMGGELVFIDGGARGPTFRIELPDHSNIERMGA